MVKLEDIKKDAQIRGRDRVTGRWSYIWIAAANSSVLTTSAF